MPANSWGSPLKTAISDADTGASRKPVRLKLETSSECAKAIARLTRAALGGVIKTEDLSRYANAIAILHRIITDGELAAITARLDAVEGKGAK